MIPTQLLPLRKALGIMALLKQKQRKTAKHIVAILGK